MTLNELRKALAPKYEFWLDTRYNHMYIVRADKAYTDKHGMLNIVQSRGAVASFDMLGHQCTYYIKGHRYHIPPQITNNFNFNNRTKTGLSRSEKDTIKAFLDTPAKDRQLKQGYDADYGTGSVALIA